MLSFFPRGVLDEILNLIESVSEGFRSCSYLRVFFYHIQEHNPQDGNNSDQVFENISFVSFDVVWILLFDHSVLQKLRISECYGLISGISPPNVE